MSKHNLLENKYLNIDQTDIDEVTRALTTRQLAGTSPVIAEYEAELAAYFKVKHALAVSSGTAALHLLLYLFDVKPGDEVIVPPTAPVMSALPILAVGARPVFADTEAGSLAYDMADLDHKITSRTKAIVSVPMWGYPTDLGPLWQLAQQHGIPVIEDASHCHGSTIENKFVGTLGDVGFFSTQERKLIATGEGGFILTNNDDLAGRVKELRDFGKFAGEYGHLFGLNFRLSAMSAALGISQLKKLPAKITQRTRNASRINQGLGGIAWLQEIPQPPSHTPNYYSMLLFTSHPSLSADNIGQSLFENQIVSDTYRFKIKPLYDLPVFKAYRSPCPKAEQLLSCIITLPTHEGLTSEDIDHIVLHLQNINGQTE